MLRYETPVELWNPLPAQVWQLTSPRFRPRILLDIILTKGVIDPEFPSGPTRAMMVVKTHTEYSSENPIVQNRNMANCMKNSIWAKSMKSEAPRVVKAPEITETPT